MRIPVAGAPVICAVAVLLNQERATEGFSVGAARLRSRVCTSRELSTLQNSAKCGGEEPTRSNIAPDILKPFPPAADPMWMCRGPVGEEDFVVSREGQPTKAELTNENILRIVTIQCSDLEVNTLVWKCMGYRFNPETEQWLSSDCFPNWRERYPSPPDFIGMQRV
jgi:hypothetical protein